MKKIIAIITILLTGTYSGCKNPEKVENNEISNNKSLTTTKEDENLYTENDSIELNNGVKWKVIPEMMGTIRSMESEINRFAKANNTELKDFKQLGERLAKNIDVLTSNCTMEGKAHDELHKWLLPYIDLVNKLNETKNKEEARLTFEELKASYTKFNLYFK